jgi:hypothetical protein
MRFIPALVSIALFVTCQNARAHEAQSYIGMQDTSLTRGLHQLPISAYFQAEAGDSLSLRLGCDPRTLHLSGVERTGASIRVGGWSSEGDSVLRIGFVLEQAMTVETEILRLAIDVLNSSDSISLLRVLGCEKNGVALSPLSTRDASIRVFNAPPVVLKETEFIGAAFPSASAMPSFSCHISVQGDVVFRVYDVGGRALIEERMQDVRPGSFVFQFSSPLFATLCDGMYTVSMETAAGSYSSPCIILH